jgi:hypothetical protein
MKECYKKIVFFLPSWAMFAKTCMSSLVIKTSPIQWGSSWTSPSFTIGHVMRGSMGFCILKWWVNVWLNSYLTYKTKYLNNICWRYWIDEIGSKPWYYEILHRLTKLTKRKFHLAFFMKLNIILHTLKGFANVQNKWH